METTVFLGTAGQIIAVPIFLSRQTQVRVKRVREVVMVDKVIAGIIWRINIDELHPSEILLVE